VYREQDMEPSNLVISKIGDQAIGADSKRSEFLGTTPRHYP